MSPLQKVLLTVVERGGKSAPCRPRLAVYGPLSGIASPLRSSQ